MLVGKGITFDSGGISIKPAANMEDMKMDMSGGAAVLGAMQALAQLEYPRRVVGLVPSSENLPNGNAVKPGDILRAMSGKTVEVINTDAEGRLILADALAYAVQELKPACIIDLATLAGAVVVALGSQATGMMGTDKAMIDRLRAAGSIAPSACGSCRCLRSTASRSRVILPTLKMSAVIVRLARLLAVRSSRNLSEIPLGAPRYCWHSVDA